MKSRRNNLPQINWGRGRLRPYESCYSLASKFCRINGVSPNRFRDFISKTCGEGYALYNMGSKGCRGLAKLLGEPYSVVKTLSGGKYRPPWLFGLIAVYKKNIQDGNYLSYCPICAQEGYHAFFHQHPWLMKCIIHGEPLKKGNSLVLANSCCHFDGLVRDLDCTFSKIDKDWISVGFKFSDLENKILRTRVAGYLKWLRQLQEKISVFDANRVSRGIRANVRYVDNTVLFSRLKWLQPMPSSVESCLAFDVLDLKPNILPLQEGCFDVVEEFGIHLWWDDLIWFYGITTILTGVIDNSIVRIKNFLNFLSEHTHCCSCHWLFEASTQRWIYFKNRDFCTYGLMCPYNLAEAFLKAKWLSPLVQGVRRSDQDYAIHYYLYMAEKMICAGLAKKTAGVDHMSAFASIWESQPYVEWVADERLTSAIQNIISCEAEKDISGILKWFNGIFVNAKFSSISEALGEVEVYSGQKPFILIWPSIIS